MEGEDYEFRLSNEAKGYNLPVTNVQNSTIVGKLPIT